MTTVSHPLEQNGIKLELGNWGNKNSNAVVDKVIQQLENKLRKIAPDGGRINEGKLGDTITILKTRTRALDLNASEIHFCRDPVRGAESSSEW